ncbi:MAG: hypothetical protein AB1861_17075 [Cyanobacteriota bacterium]
MRLLAIRQYPSDEDIATSFSHFAVALGTGTQLHYLANAKHINGYGDGYGCDRSP